MTYLEKAKLIKKRHLSVIIEWGGVPDMFINCSDMSEEGLVEFFEVMNLNNKEEINKRLTNLISKENDKQEN